MGFSSDSAPPMQPLKHCFTWLPNLDELCLLGPALPKGVSVCIGTGAQPSWPLRDARVSSLRVQHRCGCVVLPMAVPACPASANTAEGNTSYQERPKTGRCLPVQQPQRGLQRRSGI